VSTGSQGEPMSALTRMSTGDHRKVHIGSNDYIIISATPIPGNEKLVGKVINELMKLGAEVIYEKMYDVHVSGHACQDEIKTIMALTKPRFFMPVHGEYKHLMKNASIAKSMGYDSKRIIISDIGKVVETDGVDMKFTGMVPSGRVLVDGLGVGDVGSVVLRDRKLLSEDGLIVAVVSIDASSGEILAGPDLVSRGFVYMREAEDMMSDARDVVCKALDSCKMTDFRDWSSIKGKIRDDLSEYIYTRTKRKPMILPVIQEI
ncbi:MAG: ribonuclease J, partial [Angelakisella sp.]